MKKRMFVSVFALLVLSSLVFALGECTKEGDKDYYEAGVAEVEGVGTSPDTCVGDKRLMEYYCSDANTLEYEYYDCEVSCVDGACSGEAPVTPDTETCVEDWECSEWSECVDNRQTRTCEDLNECDTTTNRPSLSQSCGTTEPTATSGLMQYRYYIFGGIIAILVILYFVLRKKAPGVKSS